MGPRQLQPENRKPAQSPAAQGPAATFVRDFAHGGFAFIAAIGIAHAAKAGSFALADDVMEPLPPWIDRELRRFLQGGKQPMEEWMRQAVSVLQLEVPIRAFALCVNSILSPWS
jgi:hypothetical protein